MKPDYAKWVMDVRQMLASTEDRLQPRTSKADTEIFRKLYADGVPAGKAVLMILEARKKPTVDAAP